MVIDITDNAAETSDCNISLIMTERVINLFKEIQINHGDTKISFSIFNSLLKTQDFLIVCNLISKPRKSILMGKGSHFISFFAGKSQLVSSIKNCADMIVQIMFHLLHRFRQIFNFITGSDIQF